METHLGGQDTAVLKINALQNITVPLFSDNLRISTAKKPVLTFFLARFERFLSVGLSLNISLGELEKGMILEAIVIRVYTCISQMNKRIWIVKCKNRAECKGQVPSPRCCEGASDTWGETHFGSGTHRRLIGGDVWLGVVDGCGCGISKSLGSFSGPFCVELAIVLSAVSVQFLVRVATVCQNPGCPWKIFQEHSYTVKDSCWNWWPISDVLNTNGIPQGWAEFFECCIKHWISLRKCDTMDICACFTQEIQFLSFYTLNHSHPR